MRYKNRQYSRQEIIEMLRLAIQLAGDGGPAAFYDDEYNAMYNFLDELEQEYN